MTRFKVSSLAVGVALATVTAGSAFAAANDNGNGNAVTLEEVIVTAQKRDESATNVPITIAAITPDQIAGSNIKSVNDLQTMVPALRIDYAGAFSQPTVRGVGSSIAGVGFSSNIATYVDGFYMPSQLTTNMQLLNLQNVQVLKGPQGTLFGRNATGGAILITMLDPSPTPKAIVKASYGSYNARNLSVYGSDGLTDTLSADISGYIDKSDGHVRNVLTGSKTDGRVDRRGVRASAVWDVTDSFSAKLALEHHEWKDGTANATSAYKGEAVGALPPFNGIVSSDPKKVSNDGRTDFSSIINGAYLTLHADLGFADLVSYTMYRTERDHNWLDLDSSSVGLFNSTWETDNDAISQEFDFSGSAMNENLDWVVGTYFLDVDEKYHPFQVAVPVASVPMTPIYNVESKNKAYALFTDDTYSFNDNWSLTLGARYSYEKADGIIDILPAGGALLGVPADYTRFSDSWNSFTPRGVIAYKPNYDSKIYFSVSQGFKAGQVSPSSLQPTTVKPEKITAYELGYKYGGGAVRFDASAFYYDYKDMQVAYYDSLSAIVTNAGTSTIYGAEMQTTLALSEAWTANLAASYVHGKYDSYPQAQKYVFTQVTPMQALYIPTTVDASHNDMQRSPKFTATAGLQYETPISTGTIRVNGNYVYSSKFYFDPANQYPQAAYGLLNLNLAWIDPSNTWTVAAYGKNVFNKQYRSQLLPGRYAIQQTYGDPATYGVSVTYKY